VANNVYRRKIIIYLDVTGLKLECQKLRRRFRSWPLCCKEVQPERLSHH